MRKLLSCAVLFCGVAALTSGLGADEKKAVAKLEGGYTIVSGEEDGKPVPAEHIKGGVVRFTRDEIVSTDKEKKEVFAAKYTLDTSKKPWVINMKSTKPKEGDATGLIKKDGDTLTIIYSLPGAPVPAEFKTKEKGQHLFVLKRLAGGDK
ncbi:MAG: hypothetical protein JWO38_2651 [Gemmataceae bacterium]|nr:hypothetical protein [Gemmataceae bacterium]